MSKTLSVVYATYNEEKNLPKSLESLQDIADEIIIVDGTSSDKTVEIAKKFGAKVKITTNKPNFHINKQMAIDMATKDWILQMDADEHASEELKDEIKEILEKDSKEFNGYWMPRKNWFLGRFLMKGGQYPDYTIRFYRKGKGRLPQKDVHEQAEVEGKVGYLKSALLHYPYSGFKHYVKKWDFYNNFFANQIKEEQESKNIFSKLLYAFMYLLVRPSHWFLTTYFRHKGFVDGWQGFTFSLFSALRFPLSYIKYVGPYKFWAAVIILIAGIIRLWNFPTRWGLGGDDGRDAMIALEALKRHQLPLMGPFSSAGPFVFGGIYYWFIMFSYLILPFFVSAPWILLEILSVVTVGLLMYLGKIIKGERLALVIGILAATSPQLVVRSLSLGPHTFISTFSALALISLVLLWKTKLFKYAFLLGIWVGLALSFHYQAINLLIFLPVILLIKSLSYKQRLISLFLALIGFIIPSVPLLYWDSHQGFANIRNLLDYFFIAQYRIYVPNSWKIFIIQFVPQYWAFVVGNFSFTGSLLFVSSIVAFAYASIKRKINYIFIITGGVFLFLLFINRFYHGERSEGYLLYFVPLILLFSGNLIDMSFEYKNKLLKVTAVTIICLITIFNLTYVVKVLYTNSPVGELNKVKNYLYTKYPNSNFSFYDYKYKMYSYSMALSLLTAFDKRESLEGKKIGISCYGTKGCIQTKEIIYKGPLLVGLDDVSKSDLDRSRRVWINVNQSSAYEDLIGWLNKNQLKSTFDLKTYIMEKL